MVAVKHKVWFLREGLFAKYVMALVGLVVFVLAVNGMTETWINYRATKTTLTDAMCEKAEATAKRIDQSISELERQISWVTAASVNALDKRHNAYAQLLNSISAVNQLTWIDGQGHEVLRLSRTQIATNTDADYSRDARFIEAAARGTGYSPAFFTGTRPFMSISEAHSGFNKDVTVADIDLSFLSDYLGDTQVGKNSFAYVVDQKGAVLATSDRGPEVGKDLSKLPQVAALLAPDGQPLASGTDADGHAVLTASSMLPKLGWIVLFEQPTALALAPIRDQLVRGALLIGLGLDHRHHRRHHHGAAHAGADRGAARRRPAPRRRRFQPAHRRPHQGRAGGAGRSVQLHGGPARPDLCRPGNQGGRAHPRPRAIDRRIEGAGGGRPRGVVLARPQRRAADGGGARAGDHPCRCRADLWL